MKILLIFFFLFLVNIYAIDLEREFEYLKCKHITSFKEPFIFSSIDLYGNKFNLKDHIGKIIIITFADKKTNFKKSIYSDYKILKNIDPEKTIMVNIYYPGGISFVVPRLEVIKKLRAKIDSVKTKIKKELDKEESGKYNKIKMHWIIDWKRSITKKYNAPRHRAYVLIIDKNGKIVEKIYNNDRNDRFKFKRSIKKLYSEFK